MSWKYQKNYKQAGKCDNQKQLKDILETDMVSNTEGFTDDSPISPMTSAPVKKQRARKSLCLFTNILDVKKKTAACWVGYAKSKRKEIKYRNTPRALKKAKQELKS